MFTIVMYVGLSAGAAVVVAAALLLWQMRRTNTASRRRARHRFTTPLAAMCRCGHLIFTHEHYRDGSDCSLCECGQYRQPLPKALEWVP